MRPEEKPSPPTTKINDDLRNELWGLPDAIRAVSDLPLPEALIERIRGGGFDYGLWIARGTSKLAAMWLSMAFFELSDFRVFHLPFSAACRRPRKDLSRILYFALSESGRTREVLEAVRMGRSRGATSYAMVNAMKSELAADAHYSTNLEAGNDEGFALNSFAAMTAYAVRLADATGGGGRVPPGRIRDAGDVAARILEANPLRDLIPPLLEARRVMLLGRGLSSPIAGNISLKFREIPLMPCDAKSSEEFLHGYGEAASRNDCLTIVLVTEGEFVESQIKTASHLAGRGSNFVVVCPDRLVSAMPGGIRALSIPAADSPLLSPLSFAVAFYRMMYDLAMEMGIDADNDDIAGRIVSPASFRASFPELD
jgi:glutamine---fructose-6-phosphate transaminase (isomerizing)